MDWTLLNTIISIILGIVTICGALFGLYTRISKKWKDRRAQKKKRDEIVDNLPLCLEQLNNKIDNLANENQNTQEDLRDLKDSNDNQATKYDSMETQMLRYMINDSFYGYSNIADVPDEQLYTAADCCDVYLAKGLNHATGAKCKLIAQEIERRQKERAEGKNNG